MPNHVTNRLTIIGTEEQVKQVREAIKGEEDEQFIDFNKVAPIPNELKGTRSPVHIISKEEYDEQERRIRENELTDNEKKWGLSRGLTQELIDEYKSKFGHADWYGWQIQNWGTKWNAYDQFSIDENEIEFNTAWSTPVNLLIALSEMFPEVTFEVRYADEDFGYNVGEYTLYGGELVQENVPNGGSDEAYELAIEIQYGGDTIDYFSCNQEVFTDEYTNEDDDELSDYVSKMVDLAYKNKYYPFEDCGFHRLVLERFKEIALSDENFELVIIIDKELTKVEN
jgi:hypothetical protein